MHGPFNKSKEEKGMDTEEELMKIADGPARITRSMSKCDYTPDELPDKQDLGK